MWARWNKTISNYKSTKTKQRIVKSNKYGEPGIVVKIAGECQ